jgi:hypothetical protein
VVPTIFPIILEKKSTIEEVENEDENETES